MIKVNVGGILKENKIFESEKKTKKIFHIFAQIKVSRVPLWIGNAIFVWRVTWNYTNKSI